MNLLGGDREAERLTVPEVRRVQTVTGSSGGVREMFQPARAEKKGKDRT